MPFKINNTVVDKQLIHLVQHGINSTVFKSLDKTNKLVRERRAALFGKKDKQIEFVLFYNSRNVQRKKTSNVILAFRAFCDNLSKEEASKCALVLHTETVQDAGTDLPAVIQAICPNYNVIIDDTKLPPEAMVATYNIADVTILISSNEGFGLSIAESMMCETPTIVNVTGGLQDQIGQVDENGNAVEFNAEFSTNSDKTYNTHGVWTKPVWPAVRTIQGSPLTPYIFDDVCTWEDAAEAIMYWYLMPSEKREKCGAEGRRWAMNEGNLDSKRMCSEFIKAMDFTLENFSPAAAFTVYTVDEHVGQSQPRNSLGVKIPVIDREKITTEMETIIGKL